tara:strand:+ start:1056 stop:1217 length:162 start_codon:yes stop_codon:yes gene_type:complete
MNKFLILTFFLLLSCSSTVSKNDFDFSDDMTFDEFRIKLDKYAENNPYPNIDN